MRRDPLKTFMMWERRLATTNRRVFKDAENARDTVLNPKTARISECWEAIWNKPLYSNVRVETGECWEKGFKKLTGPCAWRWIGKNDQYFKITKDKSGIDPDNFTLVGQSAENIRNDYRIPVHRMFAIQGAAKVLKDYQEEKKLNPFKNFKNKHSQSLTFYLNTFRQDFGFGWGDITIMHMLSHFGVAVKPDRHLVRAVVFLRLVPGLKGTTTLSRKDLIGIDAAVKRLALRYCNQTQRFRLKSSPGVRKTPSINAIVRYMDKILMEASRQRLFYVGAKPKGRDCR